MSDFENSDREEIFSKAVRAGKRTYFFDVKTTKLSDYYLTITESKKRFNNDDKPFYEKHKLFLYKEDFEKFVEGLNETVDFIKGLNDSNGEKPDQVPAYSNVSFEDLGSAE